MVISITKAAYQGEYMIKFFFSDNTEKTIDFKDFLTNARNPMAKKYLEKELFQHFFN